MTTIEKIHALIFREIDIYYAPAANEIRIRPLGFMADHKEYIVLSEEELDSLFKSVMSFGTDEVIYWAITKLNTMPTAMQLCSLSWNRIASPRSLLPNPLDKMVREYSIEHFKNGNGNIMEWAAFSGWKSRNLERLDYKNYKIGANHRLMLAVTDGLIQIPIFNVEDDYMPNWARSRAEIIVKKVEDKWTFVKNEINSIIDLDALDEILFK